MHIVKPSPISEHRLARLMTWGRLTLAWLAAMLSAEAVLQSRHTRRCAMLDLMPRFIECLLVLRASALVFPRAPARAPQRPGNAPFGFVRRTPTRAQTLRAAVGLSLRRRLRPRGLAARFSILFEVLHALDAYAAQLVRRARRRLTRLTPLVAVRPPNDAIHAVAPSHPPCSADTS